MQTTPNESTDEMSEARYRALVDAAGAVVTEYDADGRWTYVSPDAGRAIGVDPELFAQNPIDLVHPEDRAAMLEQMRDLRDQRHVPPFRYRYRVRSGAWRLLESTASAYRRSDGSFRLVLATRDVTEAAAAETALRVSEARHRALAEGRRGFVHEIDAAGRKLYVSESIAHCLGYGPEDWLAMDRLQPVHPEDAPRVRTPERMFAAWEAGEVIEVQLRHRDGAYRQFEVRALNRYLTASGEARYIIRLQDVTVERERAARLAKLEAERAGLLQDLLASGETERRRVAYDLHDGPMQEFVAAGMQFEAIADQTADRGPLRSAIAGLQRGIAAVRQVMADLHPPALDDLGLAGAIGAEARRLCGEAALELTLELDRNASGPLSTTAQTVFYRVAQEAVTNACRHGRATQIDIRLRAGAQSVELLVADNGCGFDPLQAEPAHAGHRLGLVGMRERARLVDGDLQVRSEPGGGTRVRLVVPIASTPSSETHFISADRDGE